MGKQQWLLFVVELHITLSCIDINWCATWQFVTRICRPDLLFRNLLDVTEKEKNIRLLVACCRLQFGSKDSNDRLEVTQFLRFCKCCSEMFYESRSYIKKRKFSLSLLNFPQTYSLFIHAVFCCYRLLKIKTIVSIFFTKLLYNFHDITRFQRDQIINVHRRSYIVHDILVIF